MVKKRGLGGLGGPPRTQNIPDIATYRMAGAADPWSDAIARYFQGSDIRNAYQGYVPSPPQGGMTGGLGPTPGAMPIGYDNPAGGYQIYRNDIPFPAPQLPPVALPPGWSPPEADMTMRQRLLRRLGEQQERRQERRNPEARKEAPVLRRNRPKNPKSRESEA